MCTIIKAFLLYFFEKFQKKSVKNGYPFLNPGRAGPGQEKFRPGPIFDESDLNTFQLLISEVWKKILVW